MLLNRRIIVGICGGIASYKAVELVSRLQQAGALVDVIMTKHAEDFVRPLTFSTVSHRPVYTDLWEPSGQAAETHIALAEEAELLAVVPATANTIAKLAHGRWWQSNGGIVVLGWNVTGTGRVSSGGSRPRSRRGAQLLELAPHRSRVCERVQSTRFQPRDAAACLEDGYTPVDSEQ